MPPKMTFISEVFHPNGKSRHCLKYLATILLHVFLIRAVYPNGDVCISILHPPGEDGFGYEQASERWLPIHTVTTIALSVISMLSDPNDLSPANLDAAV